LDNDLTDSTDSYENSWSHYLTLAQQAATNADSIGEQLVNIGYENDVNLEGAGLQLMNITGSPTDTDAISITASGGISAGAQNGALGALLNAPIFDVVFFTTDPLKGSPSAPGLAKALGCASSSTNALCQSLQSASPPTVLSIPPANAATLAGPTPANTVRYTYLNLAPPPSTQKGPDLCASLTAATIELKGLSGGSATASPTYNPATKFDPGSFGTGIANWGGDAAAIQGALAMVSMTVNADASWNVAYGGSPAMDSSMAPGNTLWPGCLFTNGCDWTNPLTNSFNNLLRWCPATTELRSTLGVCDGGGNAWAEVNSLRWRVAGTLWLAAMMSGGIPEQMFTTPVPAANITPSAALAPWNTVFGTGNFNLTNSTIAFGTTWAGDPGAQALLSASNPVIAGNNWYAWGPHGSEMIPQWLQSIYVNPIAPLASPLVHLTGSNAAGPADLSGNIHYWLNGALQTNGVSNQFDVPQWANLAKLFGSTQCAEPVGAGKPRRLPQSSCGPWPSAGTRPRSLRQTTRSCFC
jgi:hypothetical protein